MKKKFCYEYPRPAVTTDCVVFSFNDDLLNVLLIRRGFEPFKGKWAIPGGFLEMKENTDEGALRELSEETGIESVFIEQFQTFSEVDRDPRGRTISVAYYALVRVQDLRIKAGDDASEAGWFNASLPPDMAFDHDKVLAKALSALKEKFRHHPVAFDLLPEKFTIPSLQGLYQNVFSNKNFERRNFRKKIIGTGLLIDLNETQQVNGHRGARYYSFDRKKYEKMIQGGYEFPEI